MSWCFLRQNATDLLLLLKLLAIHRGGGLYKSTAFLSSSLLVFKGRCLRCLRFLHHNEALLVFWPLTIAGFFEKSTLELLAVLRMELVADMTFDEQFLAYLRG